MRVKQLIELLLNYEMESRVEFECHTSNNEYQFLGTISEIKDDLNGLITSVELWEGEN